ncbi:MAG: DsbA family protein [Candidatus Aenigmarchaeota archaeon]|nr:DsbA family protein [Candidatus Aenigmarchaeota archaeon]
MKFKSKMSYGLLTLLILVAILFFVFAGRFGSGNFVQISESDPTLGRSDAPVTFVVFGDYQCGYTKQFFDEIYSQLKSEYIDIGKVRLVYKQFPLKEGTHSAAEASLCANEQGKFWSYVPLILERGEEWSQEGNTAFVRYAKELGLDENTFLNCLGQHKYRTQVENDYDEGKRLDVSGTPTFFINGLMIRGTVSLEDFEDILSKFSYV